MKIQVHCRLDFRVDLKFYTDVRVDLNACRCAADDVTVVVSQSTSNCLRLVRGAVSPVKF